MTATDPRSDSRAHALPSAPPIKRATWEWYIPIYFWVGGISTGAWIAAAAEDLAGGRDRHVIRAARWVSLASILAGTGLLIADLGRPDRFHHMLRIVRGRSAMSLGSWGLTLYGAQTGLAALLQAAEDGWLGRRPMLRRASRGATGRAVHLLGLPLAAFVGSYTGVLLASTSTPSWARRAGWLGPLFLSSGLSSGLAAVTLAGTLGGGLDAGARRRIARAETVALACELGLTLGAHRATRDLPSERGTPPIRRVMRAAMLGLGMAVPLGIAASHAAGRRRHRRGRGGRSGLLGAGLTLAGSLALRYLATDEGYRSASTAEDTWAFARAEPQSRPVGATPRPEVRSAATPDGKREGAPRTVEARPMKRQQDVTQV